MVTIFTLLISVFQFTLPRGERPDGLQHKHLQDFLFQFTLPRGERPIGQIAADAVVSFNSRSRGGSDPLTPFVKRFNCVSIHAPAGGATFYQCGNLC